MLCVTFVKRSRKICCSSSVASCQLPSAPAWPVLLLFTIFVDLEQKKCPFCLCADVVDVFELNSGPEEFTSRGRLEPFLCST